MHVGKSVGVGRGGGERSRNIQTADTHTHTRKTRFMMSTPHASQARTLTHPQGTDCEHGQPNFGSMVLRCSLIACRWDFNATSRFRFSSNACVTTPPACVHRCKHLHVHAQSTHVRICHSDACTQLARGEAGSRHERERRGCWRERGTAAVDTRAASRASSVSSTWYSFALAFNPSMREPYACQDRAPSDSHARRGSVYGRVRSRRHRPDAPCGAQRHRNPCDIPLDSPPLGSTCPRRMPCILGESGQPMSWGKPSPDRRTPGRTEARATRAWRWAVVQSE